MDGERAIVRRQLERRYGALPPWAEERITAADAVTLETWPERLLTAGALTEVFADLA